MIGQIGVMWEQSRHRLCRVALASSFVFLSAVGHATGDEAHTAASLRAVTVSLQNGQYANGFDRPLWLESESAHGTATGTIDAVLDFQFGITSAALSQPANWCDILMLHFNVKSCLVNTRAGRPVLEVGIGRKFNDPAARVYRVSFVFDVEQRSGDLLHVRLAAEEGPLSTRNYRIVVQASPVAGGQTVIHFSYAYDYGVLGKLAMQAYLGTLGRHKVGFTVEGEDPGGRPRYIRGMRGAIERNAMRYCLAVESFLRTLSLPRNEQIEARLQDWFTSVERYSYQLYEMDRDEYLAMKRNEIARQQAATLIGAGG